MSDKKLKTVTTDQTTGPQKVISLTDARAKRHADDRRKMERYFLAEMVQVFCEVGPKSMCPITVLEASETGCSFRIPMRGAENLGIGEGGREDFTLRMYLSKESYLPVSIRVANITPYVDNGGKYLRIGCSVDQSLKSYDAYRDLVRFMNQFAEQAKSDRRSAAI